MDAEVKNLFVNEGRRQPPLTEQQTDANAEMFHKMRAVWEMENE